MNTPASSPGASGSCRSSLREPSERGERNDRCDPRERDDFERALRDRLARFDEPLAGGDEAGGEPVATSPAPIAPVPTAPRVLETVAVPASAPRVELPTDATRAAIGTALQADAGTPVAAGLRAEAATIWDVSLNDPRGIPVELRAARVAQTTPAHGAAAWSLTLGASARDLALLVRHAPRLEERLRAQSLGDAPVRVEADDEEPR